MADDRLDRAGYAVRAATLIAENHATGASIVYGLTGPWGSGKSSVINMMAEQVEKESSTWKIARFTPWATGDVTGLLGDFYASLAHALPAKSRKLRSAFATMLTVAAPFSELLPAGGSLVGGSAEAAARRLTQQKPWGEAFADATKELKALDRSVLVVADDVDRLHGDELLALLKVIRLLGRFPGVDYLLAYDEDTLFNTLSATGLVNKDGTAARFMEKIVQYPLAVPPLLPYQVETRLRSGIVEILEDAERPVPDGLRFDPLIALLQAHLTTPRAIDRYLAQVAHHLPALDTAEVDDCDVMGLTFVRMQYSTLYGRMPGLRDELTSGHTDGIAWVDGQARHPLFDPAGLLAAVPDNNREGARRALGLLFPQLSLEEDSFEESNVRKGISDIAYFDRYFLLRVPSHDVSDKAVATAVGAAADGNATGLRALMMGMTDPTRAELALSKAISLEADFAVSPAGDLRQLTLVGMLMPMLEELSPRSQDVDRPRRLIRRWASDALLRLSANATDTGVLEALGIASTSSTMLEVLDDGRRRMADRSWFDEVLDEVERRSIYELTTHLRAGDSAPASDRLRFVIHTLVNLDRGDKVRAAIAGGLTDDVFSVGDLAARFVVLGWSSGARSHDAVIIDFDQSLFDSFVTSGPELCSELPAEELDLTDTSWANLRKYAVRHAKPRRLHDDIAGKRKGTRQ